MESVCYCFFCCGLGVYLGEAVFHLSFRQSSFAQWTWGGFFTFHGLFSSNPGGALGLSVCPRSIPVNLRSLSITASFISAVDNRIYARQVILC